jgi:glycosyltransferase involved in cell wall biosynthesis
MTWWGTTHAPGNGSTLQTIARAFPGHPIKVYAEPGHITELARNPALTAAGGVTLHSVRVSRRFPGRPGIVSLRRLAREALTLHRALRTLKRGQPALIVMLSATSTAIFAASWLARLHGRHIAVQIGLHGNLHDAGTWRSRNPIARALDMTAAMSARHGGRLRYLVLEQSIKDALAARDPAAAALTDVLPLPINIAEFDGHIATPHPPPPLRVGFVGQATEAKGIDIFLRIATALGARYPGQISFHLVGRAMPGTDPNIFVPLAEPPTDTHLPRADFIARMASLHYVVLPFRPGYYDLAASGALIDALTWLKPVLAMPVGFVQALFASAGDIGDLCADEAALRAALERLVTVPDPDRYAAQVANLRAARAARLPDALAPSYRAMLTRAFGFLAGPG